MKAINIDPIIASLLCPAFSKITSTFDMNRKAILIAIAMNDTM